jgi:RNA polymerase-binding protein DksA
MAASRESSIRPGTAEAREFEDLLRGRYAALWQDVQRELEKYRSQQYTDVIELAADPGDYALADLLVDLNVAEINRDVGEMRAIQRALERLKGGSYGACAACGEPIGRDRLRALPHATLCIECQKRNEQAVNESPSL